MSVPTLAELLVPKTKDQWTALALSQLQAAGFPTTDWASTAPERAMLESDTICLADQSLQIPQIVALVLVYYALAGAAPNEAAPASLIFVAKNWYEIDAFPATPTIGSMDLTCTSLAGPYSIAVGQLTATDGAGNLFTNLFAGTLSFSLPLTTSWQALAVGTVSNVANNTITQLITPLPGVSVNNPGLPFSVVTPTQGGTGTIDPTGSVLPKSWQVVITTTGGLGVGVFKVSNDGGGSYYTSGQGIPGGGVYGPDSQGLILTFDTGTFLAGDMFTFTTPGTWITLQGTDPETTFSLATRCLARWPMLSVVPTVDVYTAWALEALPGQITRVKVETDPAVAATVNVYCAGPSATINSGQVNAAQTYIRERAPLTDLPHVIAASATGVAITGAASYPVGSSGIPNERNAAINAYVNSIVMGSTIECAEITALALHLNAAGVPTGATNITNVQLNAGGVGVDLTLSAHNIATVTNNIVWTAT